MYFVLTNAGKAYIENHQGILPVLSSFNLGSGSNYLPSAEQTFLLGTIVYSGVPSAPTSINQNVIRYTLFVDYNVPSFSFGEVILYVDGNTPFAVGTSSSLITKSQLTSTSQGSSLSIDCYIPSSVATGYYPYADLANSSNELVLQNVGSVELLPQASAAVPNVYSVVSPASDRQSTLAISDNALWSVSDYTQYTESVTITGTSSFYIDLDYSSASPLAIPNPGSNYGDVLIQIIDGLAVGTLRVARSYQEILNTRRYTFDTPLQQLPQAGDRVRIYVKNIQGYKYWNLLSGIDPSITSGHINGLVTNPVTSLVRSDGTRALTGNWSAGNNRITNLANPIASQDAANLQTVENRVSTAIGQVSHNSISSLQGGGSTERYHLSSAQHAKVLTWTSTGIDVDSLPTASTEASGVTRLSTVAQTSSGSSGLVSITPSSLVSAVSAVSANVLQLSIATKMRELNPLVQTGDGAPSGSTSTYPSLYIDVADPLIPVSYAYSFADSTWYRLASYSVDQAVTGTSLTISGQSSLLGTDISGILNVAGNFIVSGTSTLNNNVVLGASTANTLTVKSTPVFNTNLSINGATSFPLVLGSRNTLTNLAIGQGAAGFNQPLSSITTGVDNVAIGKGAGGLISTGGQNVSVGSLAGSSVVSATNTTFIGDGAGRLSTGSRNTGIGSSALYNSSGSANTAVGDAALFSNTTGSNVGIGYQAGYSLNIGTGNTALGRSALLTSTNGNYNTAIGHNSLNQLNNNNNPGPCTAIGYGSLASLTTGGNNTAVGYNALTSAITTSDTVALGNSALSTYTGSGNLIFVGSTYPGYTVPNTARDSVIIGTQIYGSTDVTSNNVSIGYQAGLSGSSNITIGTYTRGETSSVMSGNVTIGHYASIAEWGAISQSTVVGYQAEGYSDHSVAIGSGAKVRPSSLRSISIGRLATVNGADNLAIGNSSGVNFSNVVTSTGCISIGTLARSQGTNSIAIGNSTIVTGSNSIAIGPSTTVASNNSVTIGSSSHTVYNMFTANWTNVSDIRDKKDIESLEIGLSTINKLNPVKFKWNLRDGGRVGDVDSGFIAQEVLDAIGPDNNKFLRVVNTDDANQLRISSTSLIPLMVNAINELTAEIELLRREIEEYN